MHRAKAQLATERSILTKIVRIWVEKWQKLETATQVNMLEKFQAKATK